MVIVFILPKLAPIVGVVFVLRTMMIGKVKLIIVSSGEERNEINTN